MYVQFLLFLKQMLLAMVAALESHIATKLPAVVKLEAPEVERGVLLEYAPHPTIPGYVLALYGREGYPVDPKDPNVWLRQACVATEGREGEELAAFLKDHPNAHIS